MPTKKQKRVDILLYLSQQCLVGKGYWIFLPNTKGQYWVPLLLENFRYIVSAPKALGYWLQCWNINSEINVGGV